MNNVVSLSQLITRLARVTDTDINTSRRFLRSLFAAVEEQLLAGESVTIKGVGTFKPNTDGLVAHGQSVLFIPDAELAAAVNAPFDMFEPVELAGDVNFDDEGDESAPETQGGVAAAGTSEPSEPSEPVIDDVEDELVRAEDEVGAEEPAVAAHEDVVGADVVAEPETEPDVFAEAESAVAGPEPEAPVAPRYVFPEEEEGELPPEEPLRAPVQRNSRMWIWILLIVAGGGLLGYLFAQLDSEDDSYGTDVMPEVEMPLDTATFEEVAVEELAATTAAPTADAEEVVEPAPQAEAAPAAEPAPAAKEEKPVYDTVTGTNYLAKMARKYYGRSSYWVFIYQANTDVLDNPDRIKPGTRVLIPPKSSFAEESDAATRRKADAIRAELDRKYK